MAVPAALLAIGSVVLVLAEPASAINRGTPEHAATTSLDGTTLSIPTLVAPADGSELADLTPSFVAQLDRTDATVVAHFEVTAVSSGQVEAEGVATPDDSGAAVWASPTKLGAGDYTWRVRATAASEESDWSHAWRFVRTPLRAPVPEAPTMVDGEGAPEDGSDVATDAQPTLRASVCLTPDGWQRDPLDLSMRLAVLSDDGHRVESGSIAPEASEQHGLTCLAATWRTSEPLHPGANYTVLAQMAGVDAEASAWVDGQRFRALETPEDRLQMDLSTGVVSRENYARYLLYRWFEPDRVPNRYQVAVDSETPELSSVMLDVMSMIDSLDPGVAAELNDYFATELGGQERVPFTDEEAQNLRDQFALDAQNLHLDKNASPAPEPTPVPSQVPDPTLTPVPTAEATEASQATTSRSPTAGTRIASTTLWRSTAASSIRTAIAVPDPDPFVTYVSCDGTDVRLVPKLLTKSSPARLPCRLVTPMAVFHFTTTDRDATHGVAPDDQLDLSLLDADHSGGSDGVPDEIDAIAAAYFQAGLTYRELGFGNIGRTDVMVADIPSALSVPKFGLVYVSKATSARNSVYVMRHELFHQYQYRYANLTQIGADMLAGLSNTTTAWWLEATAEWAAHKAQEGAAGSPGGSFWFEGAIGQYSRLLPAHLGSPTQALTTFRPGIPGVVEQPQYGSFLFAEYLEQLYGPQVIADTWRSQAATGERAIDAISDVLRDQHQTSLSTVVLQYQRANYTIDRSDNGGIDTYRDADRALWADHLGVDRRPAHASISLLPDRVTRRSGSVEAGGAYYVDLDLGTSDPAGVTFTVVIDATGGHTEKLAAQVAYFDNYPNSCFAADTRGLNSSPGHFDQAITLGTSCSKATLIVSNPDASDVAFGSLGDGHRGQIDFTYSILARPYSAATVVEHQFDVLQAYRVNFGPDLRRPLRATDGSATLNIDLGSAVSDEMAPQGLDVLSWDGRERESDAVVINGVPAELPVSREACTSDGRVHLLWGPRWQSVACTWYAIPKELVHDGVNTIVLPVNGYLYIYGAHITMYRGIESPGGGPDPDPTQDPGPVAS